MGNKEKDTTNTGKNSAKSFSSITDERVDDFQSADMIQKIKKIKKKKNAKNIKGIEEFDVLSNVEKPPTPPTPTNTAKTTDEPSKFSMQYIKELIYGKTVEGAENYFTEDEYEGRDKVKSNQSPYDPKQILLNWIESSYERVHAINHSIAKTSVDAFSIVTSSKDTISVDGDGVRIDTDNITRANEKDIEIVQNAILSAETIFITYYITYNWFFLIYYAKYSDIKIADLSIEKVEEWASSNNLEFLYYLFEYAFWFTSKLDNLLLHTLPEYTSRYFNGTSKFLLLYALCYRVTHSFAESFKQFFVDLLTNATGNTYINLMFAIVFILFIMSMFSFKATPQGISDTVSSMMNPLWTFIKSLLRFFTTMVISVPAGAIICGFYLIIYSLFGSLIYGHPVYSFSDWILRRKTIDYTNPIRVDIDAYIHNDKADIEDEDMCNSGGFMSWVLWILRMIFANTGFLKANIQDILYSMLYFSTTLIFISQLSSNLTNKVYFIMIPFILMLYYVTEVNKSMMYFAEDLDSEKKWTLRIIMFSFIIYALYQIALTFGDSEFAAEGSDIANLVEEIKTGIKKAGDAGVDIIDEISTTTKTFVKDSIDNNTLLVDAATLSKQIADSITVGIGDAITNTVEIGDGLKTAYENNKMRDVLQNSIETAILEAEGLYQDVPDAIDSAVTKVMNDLRDVVE
jgi:hypothetical protein